MTDRIVHNDLDIIYEKKHDTHYSRLCLPSYSSTVKFLRNFGDFYCANLTDLEFTHQEDVYRREANQLFRDNAIGVCRYPAFLHRKIKLAHIGLTENWHSPVFAIKKDNRVFLTTGHNKIYATSLRKQNREDDFKVFVLDIDKDPGACFKNVVHINTDLEFQTYIGNEFVIDISFELVDGEILPCIMQFSFDYPMQYHNNMDQHLAQQNQNFIRRVLVNSKIPITIHDSYCSSISDTSGLFEVNQLQANSTKLQLKTNQRIILDLADLLPYLLDPMTNFQATDNTYTVWVKEGDVKSGIVCPAYIG